jgi:hypothetical protein
MPPHARLVDIRGAVQAAVQQEETRVSVSRRVSVNQTDHTAHRNPLTISDMSELGLRITGATGEAKLKVCLGLVCVCVCVDICNGYVMVCAQVLRALKIITITKTGGVFLC